MQQREKILALVLTVVVVGGGGPTLYDKFFKAPLSALKNEDSYWDNQVAEKEAQLEAILRARRQLKEWGSRGLPSDPRNAQRLYQQWLTDLALSSGISEPTVSPVSRSTTQTYYAAVRVELEAKTNYQQLCRFLHRFHRADLLHRIADLDVERDAEQADLPLSVTLTAEGLSLPNAVERKRLFARTELAGPLSTGDTEFTVAGIDGFPQSGPFRVRIGNELMTVSEISGTSWSVMRAVDDSSALAHPAGVPVELAPVSPAMQDVQLSDYATLLAFNPFVKPGKSPEPDQDEPQAVTDETAKSTRLVGYFAEDADERALLYNSSTQKQTELRVGTEVSVGEIRGTVIDIKRTFVLLRIGDETFRLNTGDVVSAMKKVPPSAGNRPESTKSDNAEPASPPQDSAAESS